MLVVVIVVILGLTTFRLIVALRGIRDVGSGELRRVRQEYRLISRSWLELDGTRWVPVYFDPALITAADLTGLRLYPAGRIRHREPVGRLIDNPSRPDTDAYARAARANRWSRRLLLDSQSAVAGPFAALLWIYLARGGVLAFVGATIVASAAMIWLNAIRGSDPS